MYSRTWRKKSTKDCSKELERLQKALREADAVVVGAGAGLSAAAGFSYSGARFEAYFSDFAAKYGFHGMYMGGSYPYETPEEYWAYWSRYIFINRYMDAPKPVYDGSCSSFPARTILSSQQTSTTAFRRRASTKSGYFTRRAITAFFSAASRVVRRRLTMKPSCAKWSGARRILKIPTELVPVCPHCGRPMTMNLRCDDTFVQDEGWHKAAERYEMFLRTRKDQRIVFLELGVGYNTPVIIKYPFWRMTERNPKAVYASINLGEAITMREIETQSVLLDMDIGEALRQLT
ncbi:MAG: Sir2 silent information regulator family NAD-dependent deacetylase [Oscillospiraceae bacterium]